MELGDELRDGSSGRAALHSSRAPSHHEGSPSNASRAATPTTVDSSSPIVSHKITKRDTLAGLAIRYNVTVGDIKRANGLLSDNALYARETVQIPTGGLPLGEELQLIFAQVATGFGRDPVLHAEANLHPASAAVARVARILHNNEDYVPGAEDPHLPWWCRCGTCCEDENRVACRSRRFTDSSEEYELQERNMSGGVLIPPDSSSGPTRFSEQVRRRGPRPHGDSDMDSQQEQGEAHPSMPGYGRPPRSGRPPRANTQLPPNGTSLQGEGITNVMQKISDFGKSLGDLSLIQRIKAAANQPALAGPMHRTQSFGSAAEGVLGSLKASFRPNGQRASGSTSSGLATPMLPRSHHAHANGPGDQRRRSGNKTD